MWPNTGTVTFVGAGPGDPELLTLKAKRLLGEADVVVYAGSLIDQATLNHARPDAARYNSAGMPLDDQLAVMREACAKGQVVVRLHSGDPAIYGATSEQMRRMEEEGIPYRVVPGVSSAFAAAAALRVELTIPESTQTVIFSRLEGRTPVPDREALQSLAAHRSSLVLFLSAGMIARVVEKLRSAGYADDTPIAVAFRVTWPDERIIRGTLADIAQKVEAAEVTHHALIIVSPALDRQLTEAAPDSHLYGAAFDKNPLERTLAIVALTRGGTATGRTLLHHFAGAVLYAPERFCEPAPRLRPYNTSVRQVLQSAFQRHRALICIMAAGIVVRDLAPLLRSKHSDPAVVVVDEAGRHAISLLGGHEGGANAIAEQVANALNGDAVLTTASDVLGLPALDLLGQAWGWHLEAYEGLTATQAALVNGDPLGVVQHAGSAEWLPDPRPENLTVYPTLEALVEARPSAAVLITHRAIPDTVKASIPAVVVYRPPSLCVGVGCKRDTPANVIAQAITTTLEEAGLSIDSLLTVASIEDKADEPGLLAACQQNDWPLRIFTRDAIEQVERVPNPSPTAQEVLGVRGVAEPAALLAAEASTLLVDKRKYDSAVTVAVAEKASRV